MQKTKSNLIKNAQEIAVVREACAISSQLHWMALSASTRGLSEYAFSAKIREWQMRTAAKRWAYPVIIGAGERGTILHARPTNRRIRDNELVLVDMGVHYGGFASDITRTWPAGSRFTREQKIIYKIVLRAQEEVIRHVKPGRTLNELHELARNILREGTLGLGLSKRRFDEVYPHKTSHWIGRLVHDACPYFYRDGSAVELAPGMLFTVEPGLYFKNTRTRYDGIGVRIEDVVLVTETGSEVITHVPKEVEEIEFIRSTATVRESI